ncbi:hypothetical protein [Brevundimonas sp.]|uniref:hypothetical protein n=1 Tax=Brevundimonas sp. TaxID=1871086 RepID=UPI00262CD002|nr:hypothetical protein [Brevundimonas sp.]
MSPRLERTEPTTLVAFPGGKEARVPTSCIRTTDEVARMQAMAEDVGHQLLEERDGEPGFFPYTPDPIAEDLINSAFKRGVELGRRLERQDAGQIVSIVSPACTGEHDDGPAPPPHGQTGKRVTLVLIIATAGYFIARAIQTGGGA